jgi:hypothetical protein
LRQYIIAKRAWQRKAAYIIVARKERERERERGREREREVIGT